MEIYQSVYAPILEINIDGSPIEIGFDQSGAIPGADGRSIEMRQFEGSVQWRNVGDTVWIELFDLDTLVVSGNTEIKTISASVAALADDSSFLILLDGTSAAVTYTIDPALWEKKRVKIRCIDATNEVKVAVSAGVIELQGGDDVTSVDMLRRDTFDIYSDGSKIIIL